MDPRQKNIVTLAAGWLLSSDEHILEKVFFIWTETVCI